MIPSGSGQKRGSIDRAESVSRLSQCSARLTRPSSPKNMNNPIEELATKIRSFLGRVAEGALDVGAFAVVATDEVYSVLDGLRTLQSTHAWCLTPSFPPYVIFAMATTARETSGLATGHAIYRFIRDWLRQ